MCRPAGLQVHLLANILVVRSSANRQAGQRDQRGYSNDVNYSVKSKHYPPQGFRIFVSHPPPKLSCSDCARDDTEYVQQDVVPRAACDEAHSRPWPLYQIFRGDVWERHKSGREDQRERKASGRKWDAFTLVWVRWRNDAVGKRRHTETLPKHALLRV